MARSGRRSAGPVCKSSFGRIRIEHSAFLANYFQGSAAAKGHYRFAARKRSSTLVIPKSSSPGTTSAADREYKFRSSTSDTLLQNSMLGASPVF